MSDVCDQAAAHAQRALHVSIWHMQVRIANMMTASKLPEVRRCVDCDIIIPKARLAIIPGAIRCVKCQEIYESCHREDIFDE